MGPGRAVETSVVGVAASPPGAVISAAVTAMITIVRQQVRVAVAHLQAAQVAVLPAIWTTIFRSENVCYAQTPHIDVNAGGLTVLMRGGGWLIRRPFP
jgi:hypothetical protein